MLKDFQVDLELSPRDNRVIQTGATYWSHDVNTAKIVVNLKRNSEPIILSSTVSVRMIMVFDDNDTQKKQVHKMTIDDTQNGVVSLILPKETLGFVGNVLCGVYVNCGENQSTDNGYFTFSMRRSLIDGEFPQLENGYVSEFQTMLDYMIETASEFDNVEEELNKRIDVIQKDIASNEVAKKDDFINLKEKVDKNKIGGVNYLINSSNIVVGGLDFEDGSRKEYQLLNIGKTFQENFVSSDEVTISFDIETKKGVKKLSLYNTGNKGPFQIERRVLFDIPVGKSRQSITTNLIKRDNPNLSADWIEFFSEYGTSDWYEITKIKIEKGNNATDYSQSIGDIATKKDISGLQKQIDELKNAITSLGGTL